MFYFSHWQYICLKVGSGGESPPCKLKGGKGLFCYKFEQFSLTLGETEGNFHLSKKVNCICQGAADRE